MRRKLHSIWLWGLLFLMTACGDDDYYYPPVKLEFVTVKAGGDGCIQTLIPDKGESLPVLEDRTRSAISPNTSRRVMSNYEVLAEGVCIYSLQSLITPEPKPEDDPVYKDGIKTDPVEMVSIWLGRNYLNMILNLKVSTGKGHVFGIVEDISELETKGIVNMLLYHDANSDAEYYNRRAYISVPLEKYVDAENPDRVIKIKFKYYKYGEDGTGEESDKYCNPGFDYIPELN
ncbi:MAG: NigD-like protein [Bacteroides acidifaciens]|uniref:NigD-like protein n=1 Tax=Bacteroides acidifaciens TaxID=85831 RepID=UPI0023D30102|nr:NigD-like protein [Bacteroides acidifaciens]MDE6821752.1 NigD-like protein [Bacteroides acidifaciens]MDE6986455.1 NigD-like protein [Bacteroides acidifaciens]